MMKIISLRYFRTNFPLVTQLRFRPLMTRFKQEVGAVVSLVAVGVEDVTEEVALLAGEVEGSLEGPTVQLEPIQACVTVLTLKISIEIFSPEEWRQLPNFVRDSIRNARAQKKARRDEAQLRGVAAASTHNNIDDTSSVTGSQQTEITQNMAGRGFGRNAYQGRGGNNTGRGGNQTESS